jgi:hypothetical protein
MKTFTLQAGFCKGEEVRIDYSYYPNGRVAILLIDPQTEELVAKCTCNIPAEELDSNEVIIKTYSENEGLYEELVREKVVYPAHRITKEQKLPICRLVDIGYSNK